MNDIAIFKNDEFGKIRTVIINNKPYFMASDISKALGYARPNDAVRQHCRATVKYSTPISGKMQEVNYIPEGDLYRLISHSKLEAAERFENWVFDEVLPTIRKTGGFVNNDDLFINIYLPHADKNTKAMFKTTLQTVRSQNELIEKQQLEINTQKEQITEMEPKVSYYDKVLQCNDLLNISIIAKDYGWGGAKMNEFLHEHHVQYKQGNTWLLYCEHANKGYTGTKTDKFGKNKTKIRTCWTQEGRLFIYNLMKENGYLPLMERNKTN